MSQTLPVQLALADAESGEGEVPEEQPKEAALSQGSVDDLLASLGF